MRVSGFTPTPVIIESRQQHFAARAANACRDKLRKLHRDSSSATPVCRAVREEHEQGRTTKVMTDGPGPTISGQKRQTGRRHRSPESRPALGKREYAKVGAGITM